MPGTYVRLTWPWRLIAPMFALVAMSYPVLVTQIELRRLDRGDILPPALIFAFSLAYWWYAAHAVLVTADGATFRDAFRERTLLWADVTAYEVTTSWVIARDVSGRKYRVSSYATNATFLADELRRAASSASGRG